MATLMQVGSNVTFNVSLNSSTVSGWSHTRTITQTDRNRYQKSLPSTRNRHQKLVRSHETARKRWRRCSTYAGPVSGAVLLPLKQRRRLPRMVAMVALLFILRCGRSGSFSPSQSQAFAPNTHLSASSKGRGNRAAEFQFFFAGQHVR